MWREHTYRMKSLAKYIPQRWQNLAITIVSLLSLVFATIFIATAIIDYGFLDLDSRIIEQLEVEFPIRFLCKEDCKGLCSQCGADLNINECSCQKDLTRKNPFSALASLLN